MDLSHPGCAPHSKATKTVNVTVPQHLAARKDLGLHPLFLVIDEVHILFGDEQVGGKTGRATNAMKALLNMARAFNIHLAFQRLGQRRCPLPVGSAVSVACRVSVPSALRSGESSTTGCVVGRAAADGEGTTVIGGSRATT
jgi:hypothetical protein